MNVSSILGFAVAILVFVGGVMSSTSHWKIYLDIHAFFIVFGGTLAATLISFPISHLLASRKTPPLAAWAISGGSKGCRT